MDEETTLYAAIAAAVTGVAAWIAKFFVSRVMERLDVLEDGMGHVKEHCIKASELIALELKLLESIHQNSEEIKARIEHADNRIDELFRMRNNDNAK